ncbi:unnamed protein product [Caenorhabditis nigoni]
MFKCRASPDPHASNKTHRHRQLRLEVSQRFKERSTTAGEEGSPQWKKEVKEARIPLCEECRRQVLEEFPLRQKQQKRRRRRIETPRTSRFSPLRQLQELLPKERIILEEKWKNQDSRLIRHCHASE